MDRERALITQVLRNNLAREVIDRKITLDLFSDANNNKPVMEFIIDFYTNYNTTPNQAIIDEKFPNYELETAEVTFDWLCDQLRERDLFNKINESMIKVSNHQENKETFESIKEIRELNSNLILSESAGVDKNWSEDSEERYDKYLKIKEKEGLLGIPTPFPGLTHSTGGFGPGQFWHLSARMGKGKSWILLWFAYNIYKLGYKVLFFRQEMTHDECAERLDAMNAEIPFGKLRFGELTDSQENRYLASLKDISNNGALWLTEENSAGVLGIEAKIDKHSPDIVFIDGLHLISDGNYYNNEQKRLEDLSRKIKMGAKKHNVPIIGSGHLNREAGDNDANDRNIRGTDALGQDADVILMMFQNEEQKDDNELNIKMKKLREGRTSELWEGTIQEDFSKTSFTEITDSNNDNNVQSSFEGLNDSDIDTLGQDILL